VTRSQITDDANTLRSDEDLTARQPVARPPEVALTQYTVATVHELLALAEEFFRTASPAVRAELLTYLDAQVPPADPSWFIDMLGLNAMHLARHLPASAPGPREAWSAHTGANIRDDKWGQNT
jgi:hypothetical protein